MPEKGWQKILIHTIIILIVYSTSSFHYHYMVSKKSQKLGENIQKRRKKLGLTQDKFSRKADIPYTTLTKIEQGEIKGPSVYVVDKIAKNLNTKIERLIG